MPNVKMQRNSSVNFFFIINGSVNCA